MLCLLTLITIVHEFAHFVVAKYFKFNVREFSIGTGFPIFEQKILNINFVLKLATFAGGHIQVYFEVNKFKQMDDRRLVGIICTSLAGPFINIASVFFLFHYPAFALMSLFSGIGNLLPFEGTDGSIALGATRELIKRKRS